MCEQGALISVVIPAYHVEEYIEKCIHSVCAQTYRHMEILLVCSPSRDRTEALCRDLAQKDARIKLFKGDGSGVSASRNIALEAAQGEYIAFVDADDYVEPGYLMNLYEGIRGNDIAVCGFDRVKRSQSKAELMGEDIHYEKDALIADILCNNTVGGYLWNKMFRADIIKGKKIRFCTDLSVGEDMVFLASYMLDAKQGYYRNEILYHYRLNEHSALQQMYTTGVFDEKKLSNMRAAEYIAEILQQESRQVQDAVAYRIVRTGMWTFFNMLKCSYYKKAILQTIKKQIKENVLIYCKNPNAKLIEKLAAILLRIWPEGFWHMARFLLKLVPKKLLQKYVK